MDTLTAHIKRYLNPSDEKLARIGEFFEERTYKKKNFSLEKIADVKRSFSSIKDFYKFVLQEKMATYKLYILHW